jgi:hypothetical protein
VTIEVRPMEAKPWECESRFGHLCTSFWVSLNPDSLESLTGQCPQAGRGISVDFTATAEAFTKAGDS